MEKEKGSSHEAALGLEGQAAGRDADETGAGASRLSGGAAKTRAGGSKDGANQAEGEGRRRGSGASDASGRGEISAATVGRLLGLATVTELQFLENKIDLMSNRVNNLTVRMEKVLGVLGNMPTGSDLERIDVQISALRTLIKEMLGKSSLDDPSSVTEAGEGNRFSQTAIKTNTPQREEDKDE